MHALFRPSPEAHEICQGGTVEECFHAPSGFLHIPVWSEVVLGLGLIAGFYTYYELKKRSYEVGHGSVKRYIKDTFGRRNNSDSDYGSNNYGYGASTPFD